MKMFLDTVHFSPHRHFGVVLDTEGFILGKTPMFRTAKQAFNAAHTLRDEIMTRDALVIAQATEEAGL